jgi:hypothetical protein
MTENNAAAFDKNAFSTLLDSDDAALLSPLFDRAFESLTQFVNAENFDYSQLEFDAYTLKTTCPQLGGGEGEKARECLLVIRTCCGPRRRSALRCTYNNAQIRVRTNPRFTATPLRASDARSET